jgi:hypothetical protein
MITITILEDGQVITRDDNGNPLGFIQSILISSKKIAFMSTKEQAQRYDSTGLTAFYHTLDTLSRNGFVVYCIDDTIKMNIHVSGDGTLTPASCPTF